MKTLLKHSLLYLSVAALLFTFSCGEDEEEPTAAAPSIGVSFKVEGATATTAYPDDSISFVITASAEAQVNALIGYINDSQIFRKDRNELGLTDLTSAEFGGYTKPEAGDVGETWTFTFVVVDDLNQTDTASFSVDIIEAPAPIDEFTAVLLGGQVNSTLGSYYDATGNTVYLNAGARDNNAKIDLLFYYVGTEGGVGAVIASPDNSEAQATFEANSVTWPFTTENQTRFKPAATSVVFANVTTGTAVAAAYSEVGTAESRITNLVAGQVVAFQQDAVKGSKYGIFEVVEITGTGGSDRAIKINVKIQK